ncbi:MAG: hypothetical protein Q8882_08985 [Bacillota bacterium]|nr:hypothetical protein [Bacillota bacterium]
MDTEFFLKMKENFEKCREQKQELDGRIIENDLWYRSRHKLHNNEYFDGEMITPSTDYLFSTLANKHADAMDNYPAPNILEREPADREVAEALSKIIPAELEIVEFKKIYSRAWWYKLKNGAAAYGIFYEPTASGGRGDIVISNIDLLNIFWKNGVRNIQDSPYVFITNIESADTLRESYPDKNIEINVSDISSVRSYQGFTPDSDSALVVDCYYKKNGALHLLKYTGDEILYSSEDEGLPTLYDHGKYPIVIDAMYPIENSPVGFGVIDIVKNPQTYIDKLDSIISRNAMIAGRPRWVVKDNGGINENELLDLENDVVHVSGSVNDENIKQLQAKQLGSYILEHRHSKISEMKEIAGNRDFSTGGTGGGVTAYGAIVALQQAGEKMVRDMISESYESYKEIIQIMLELVRQFFDAERTFRITGESGTEYVNFSGQTMGGGFYDDNAPTSFDVSVIPEKNNPFSKITANQTAMSLWNMGVFQKGREDEALAFLEMMSFDGKTSLKNYLLKRKEESTDVNRTGDRQSGSTVPQQLHVQ